MLLFPLGSAIPLETLLDISLQSMSCVHLSSPGADRGIYQLATFFEAFTPSLQMLLPREIFCFLKGNGQQFKKRRHRSIIYFEAI